MTGISIVLLASEWRRAMGQESIVSKRTDWPSKTWLKSKNSESEAARREREKDWR